MALATTLRAGIIGCGNISTAYLERAALFRGFAIVACADLDRKRARERAGQYGISAMTPKDLIATRDIDIVVNLTIPAAHFELSIKAVKAGKHVYSEKPLALSLKHGLALARAAKARGVKVCCAPDTFLGGAHQRARKAIDDGEVGRITSGTAAFMSFGMEHWHPDPDFFYRAGGGPVLDMGPYYIANLINLIGPVKRVAALTSMARRSRTISSQPRKGEKIAVRTPTNAQALLEFANGATMTMLTSWDVWAHRHASMELYGTEGSLFVPDPNFFGGEVVATRRNGRPEPLPAWDHPLGIANDDRRDGKVANYRCAGLAELADAILRRREARCSIDRTLHALEVMTAILRSGKTGRFVDMTTTCTRPRPFGPEEARRLMR